MNKIGFLAIEMLGLFAKIREMVNSFDWFVDPDAVIIKIVLIITLMIAADLVLLPEN